MTNPDTLTFSCSSVDDFILSTHDFAAQLPSDFRARFLGIVKDYLINYDTMEAYTSTVGGAQAALT
jgi:hypothetical protein